MRAVLVSLILLQACGLHVEPEARPPNFVIIMADDLGYGDLSTYGGWIEVPNLDRMAAEGLRFTDFHSNGAVCSPTRAALMTGRYQQRAGIPIVIFAPEERPTHIDGLQDIELTFAEMLRERGYATGIVGKWHLGYYLQYNPVRHGFDSFRGYVSGNVDFFSHVDGAGRLDWWNDAELSDEEGYVTTLISEHAVRFIEQHRDEPFCLYVPHEAPHSPYQGPDDDPAGFRVVSGYSGGLRLEPDEIRQRYRDMVVEMDRGIGAILETLRRLDLAERTLVFFFSDNGATPNGSNAPLRGGKGTVWEGGHRVPAIAWQPGSIAANQVTDQLAATMDIWPTLAELAGWSSHIERPLDGISLVPTLRGAAAERGAMFWSFMAGLAVREGNWKLVVGEDGVDRPMLFDLASDVGEQNNLAADDLERAARMERAAHRWLQEVRSTATPQPSDEKR